MFVEDETAAYRIERHAMNKNMRDVLVYKALKKFKEAGYIRINKDEDGKYALVAKVRGEGGGPILAGIFYYGTKALLWYCFGRCDNSSCCNRGLACSNRRWCNCCGPWSISWTIL